MDDEAPARAGAVDAVSDHGRPDELDLRLRLQPGGAQVDLGEDRAGCRAQRHRARLLVGEADVLQGRVRIERRSHRDGPVEPLGGTAVVLGHLEGEVGAGSPRDRRLLDVQVVDADRVADVDHMISDRAGRPEPDSRRPACPIGHDGPDVLVVVVEGRTAFVQRRAQTRVRERDHRPDRATPGRHLRRPGDQEPALGDLRALDDGVDVVDAAEVLRRLEPDGEGAVRVGFRRGEDDCEFVCLPSEVVDAVRPGVDDPRDVSGSPGDRHVLVRRQVRARNRHGRAGDARVRLRRQDAHVRRGRGRRCDRARQRRDSRNCGRNQRSRSRTGRRSQEQPSRQPRARYCELP